MTEWITHKGKEPPALAPAAYLECVDGPNEWVSTVSRVDWCSGIEFHQLRDPDGVPYCSPKGLEPWAEYVATDEDGYCVQMDFRPQKLENSWLPIATWRTAPDTHRHPSDWNNSLMRVWRE